MSVEVGRNFQKFPNGATVLSVTMSDEADPPKLVTVTMITRGQGGALPPGYDADPAKSAFGPATIAP